jgi:hypothetical protein
VSSETGLTHVGNLATTANGNVTISAGNLTVNGDLAPNGTGAVVLSTEATELTVTGNVTISTLTDTGGKGVVTLNGSGTNTIAAYTAKATADATTFAGSAALTITALTGNASAATVTFNGTGTATIAAYSALAGDLTIAGSGAVVFSAAPTLTAGGLVLTNTNAAGVLIPSLGNSGALGVSKSINASAGKVIFGNSDHSTTIVKGTLTNSAAGTVTVAANGVISLTGNVANNPSFALEDGGSITFAGANAALNVNASTPIVLSGGSFTNTGDVLTLTPGADATTATLTGTALTKLALGSEAKIAIPAAATTGLVLTGVLVDLSANGQITIAEHGILVLGDDTAGANYVAGIITKYNGTTTIVAAGGKTSGDIATTNISKFATATDYAAVVTAISDGLSVAGTITGGSSDANNTIDKDDTFAVGTAPAINVTGV